MNGKSLTFVGCIAWFLGLALLLDLAGGVRAIPICPHEAASEAVGSCGTPQGGYQCSSADGQPDLCGDDPFLWYEVKQDFPTDCLSYPDKKCDQPDENCYRRCQCEYNQQTQKCVTKQNGTFGLWTKKPKRTTNNCTT